MRALFRLGGPGGDRWAVGTAGSWSDLDVGLADLLAVPLERARAVLDGAVPDVAATSVAVGAAVLAPVDRQEVWAAGVTYRRSREGRREESGHAALYDAVYDGDRPELFFKASPWRVVGDGDSVGIRGDSAWNVPEAELALVLNSAGELFGYTLGNDVSSRDIEGANPLYLPQAKVYDRSCALGPAIVPVWEAGPGPFDIELRVHRRGRLAYAGATSTAAMARGFDDLAGWLCRALTFPTGAVLLTGTGIVPDRDFGLLPGDVVTVAAPGLGTLTNSVVAVGRGASPGKDRGR